MKLGFNDYQMAAHKFAAYPQSEVGMMYPILALAEEAGEVVGKVAKAIRKDVPVDKEALVKELGDVLWNVAEIATWLDTDLEDVAAGNIEKLADRDVRNVLVGEGDNR